MVTNKYLKTYSQQKWLDEAIDSGIGIFIFGFILRFAIEREYFELESIMGFLIIIVLICCLMDTLSRSLFSHIYIGDISKIKTNSDLNDLFLGFSDFILVIISIIILNIWLKINMVFIIHLSEPNSFQQAFSLSFYLSVGVLILFLLVSFLKSEKKSHRF